MYLNGSSLPTGKKVFMKNLLHSLKDFAGKEFSFSLWWRLVAFTVLGIMGSAALLVYVVDPHYRYRLPKFYKTVYYEIYATAPRLISDMEYDFFMLGSSMCRNFFLEDIDKAFSCKSMKFAAAGASTIDLCKFVDMAVKAKGDKLKRILFSLDIYALNKTAPHWKDFSYMYRKDHKEDYKYIFHKDTYSSIHYLFKRAHRPKGKRKYQADKNRMFSTEHEKSKYGTEYVKVSAEHCYRIHHSQTPLSPAGYKNLKNELLAMVDSNPGIEFIIFLPPYHIYSYCLSEIYGEAEGILKLREDALLELIRRKNVKLFDFQSDPEIVCNGSYFTDIQHFSSKLAGKLLFRMAEGRYQLKTKEDVRKNVSSLRKLIRENMPSFRKDVSAPSSTSLKGGK